MKNVNVGVNSSREEFRSAWLEADTSVSVELALENFNFFWDRRSDVFSIEERHGKDIIKDLKRTFAYIVEDSELTAVDYIKTCINAKFMYRAIYLVRLNRQEAFENLVREHDPKSKTNIYALCDVNDRIIGYDTEPKFGYQKYEYANFHGYSDVEPCEIIEVKKTAKTLKIIVRGMESVLTQAPPCHIGGFAGHTENYAQRWDCISNPEGRLSTLSLRKNGDLLVVGCSMKHKLHTSAIKFYDYNF